MRIIDTENRVPHSMEREIDKSKHAISGCQIIASPKVMTSKNRKSVRTTAAMDFGIKREIKKKTRLNLQTFSCV